MYFEKERYKPSANLVSKNGDDIEGNSTAINYDHEKPATTRSGQQEIQPILNGSQARPLQEKVSTSLPNASNLPLENTFGCLQALKEVEIANFEIDPIIQEEGGVDIQTKTQNFQEGKIKVKESNSSPI